MPGLEKTLRWAVVLNVFLLLGALGGWQIIAGTPSWLAALVMVPLLLPIRGLARGQRQTFRWTLLLLVPYLTYAVMESVANPPARVWAAVVAALGSGAFAILGLYLRVAR